MPQRDTASFKNSPLAAKAMSHQHRQVTGLEHLTILDTTSFTHWHAALSACIDVLTPSTDHTRVLPEDLQYAPKGFWKYLAHLMQTVLDITKALVAFLQYADCLGAFDNKNGCWARSAMSELWLESRRYQAAVLDLSEIMEWRVREKRAKRGDVVPLR